MAVSIERPGWSADDLQSILEKLRRSLTERAGEPFIVSEREMRAHIAYMKERGKKSPFAA